MPSRERAAEVIWFKVAKGEGTAPPRRHYQDWRDDVAREARYQCVYCAISEADFGGARNYHIEHYRPKKKFPQLANEYTNLFYSCCLCNVYKRDDWPAEPDPRHSVPAYPSPAEWDYCEIFDVDADGWRVSGKYVAAKYMVEKLNLNRPQLISARRLAHLRERLQELYRWVREVLGDAGVVGKLHEEDTTELLRLLGSLGGVDLLIGSMRPYEERDLRNGGGVESVTV